MPDSTSRFTHAKTGQPILHFMGCSTFSEVRLVHLNLSLPSVHGAPRDLGRKD